MVRGVLASLAESSMAAKDATDGNERTGGLGTELTPNALGSASNCKAHSPQHALSSSLVYTLAVQELQLQEST